MYCTQNLGHNIEGAIFISKLTKKDKIEIYKRSKNAETVVSLAKFLIFLIFYYNSSKTNHIKSWIMKINFFLKFSIQFFFCCS